MQIKKTITLMLLILLTFLTAFSKQNPILIKNVEINVIKTVDILRYDIILKKTKELKLYDSEAEDSPGHHHMFHHGNGLNFAVRPNNALASLMELESNTKYVKMKLRGGGDSGNFSIEEERTLSLEYAIKKGVDYEEVRKSALDSTLLVLMGNKVIAEIPLSKSLLSNVTLAHPEHPDKPQDAIKLTERLKRLEPDLPKDIADPPFFQSPFPLKVKSAQEIIKNGRKLTYNVLLDKPDWVRAAYKSYWHSSVSGRWSFVPNRLHYAQHRLFTAPTAALSNYYDFVHNLGLHEELMNVQAQPQDADRERFIGQIMVVVMQAKIEKVLTSGNQVVIVARPQRKGVRVLTVNKVDMKLDNPNEAVLFRLVTTEGDEIDYSLY